MPLALCNSVLPAACSTKLVCTPDFSGEEGDKTTVRIKSKTCQKVDEPSCMVSGYLEQWSRHGSISMYGASEAMA